MTRLREARSITFAFAAVLAVAAAMPASAGTDAPPAPVSAEKAAGADAPVCKDDAPTAAQRAEREAKLADLGRRLHAEAAVQRDVQVLNRTGLNYSDRRPAPPAPAPASAKP